MIVYPEAHFILVKEEHSWDREEHLAKGNVVKRLLYDRDGEGRCTSRRRQFL